MLRSTADGDVADELGDGDVSVSIDDEGNCQLKVTEVGLELNQVSWEAEIGKACE